MHLMRNKAYVVNLVSVVCGGYILLSVYATVARYVEIHFIQPASIAGVVAGFYVQLPTQYYV